MNQKRFRRPLTAHALLAASSLLVCQGCAVSYVDEDGARRVIGLVSMTIRPDDGPTVAGNVVDIRTVGVSMIGNEQGTTLALGYAREVTAALRDHAHVVGNPLRAAEGTR